MKISETVEKKSVYDAMVLILNGNSEIGMHVCTVWNEIGNLTYLRHLLRSIEVGNLI